MLIEKSNKIFLILIFKSLFIFYNNDSEREREREREREAMRINLR